MAKFLLLYSSHDGQTRQIMTHIRQRLEGGGTVDFLDLHAAPPVKLSGYDAVLVGASIRYGHFSRVMRRYVSKHASELNGIPSAFMGVCLTARKPEKRTPETNIYLRKFLERTPWKPGLATAVAGALLYPRYKWYDRLAIQMIMRMTGGETDPSKEIIYTDWAQVDAFCDRFASLASRQAQPA